MGIVAWIVFGLIAGFLANWLAPGKGPGGIVYTIVLGVAGALLGGFIGNHLLGIGDAMGFNLQSMALAVGGALLLLFGYAFLKKNRML
jgi:uncharacterized membrane protein YeaQ/YmgE (transglycosylase-associated protein family)